jgi:uncharacterized membrane protein YdcZ (DUF606 family)
MIPIGMMVGFFLLSVWGGRWLKKRRFAGWDQLEAQKQWDWYGGLAGMIYVAALIAANVIVGRSNEVYVVIGVTSAGFIGCAALWVHGRWLQAADELVRKIETEAYALAFGLTFVGIIASEQLVSAGIIVDRGLWGVARVMLFSFLIARFIGYKKYRDKPSEDAQS